MIIEFLKSLMLIVVSLLLIWNSVELWRLKKHVASTEFQYKQIVVQSKPTLYWSSEMPVICKELKDK
jgi:hypothetical protein